MEERRFHVGVVGATGFAGAELLRLLLAHPHVEVKLAASSSAQGQPLAAALPALTGLTKLALSPVPARGQWPELDLVFLCLPHGASRDLLALLPDQVRVVDLGGDFRLKDGEAFATYYGTEPPAREVQKTFVYGMAEITAPAALAGARRVANPGCFATASILALAPLVKADLIEPRVIIDAKTGSTGAGAKPLQTTVHASRSSSLYGYKSFNHQHLPEIRQSLAAVARDGCFGDQLVSQAHATPLVRGIFATVYAQLRPGHSAAAVAEAYQSCYEGKPFIRLHDGSPNVGWSRGSNFVDLGWASQGRELTVFSALDNLGKGAAGQAVQNMNLMLGLPGTTGLWQAGSVP